MKKIFLYLTLFTLIISCKNKTNTSINENSSLLYLDDNGVTVKCKEGVYIGYVGKVNGIDYTVVNREMLKNNNNLKNVCTCMITNMKDLFLYGKNYSNLFEDIIFEILFITALITPLASTPGCLKKFLSSADKNALITFFGIELNGTNTLFS